MKFQNAALLAVIGAVAVSLPTTLAFSQSLGVPVSLPVGLPVVGLGNSLLGPGLGRLGLGLGLGLGPLPARRIGTGLFMAAAPQDSMTIDLDSASPEEIDSLVRHEYSQWLIKYQKSPPLAAAAEARYQIFKQNYLLQLAYDQQVGVRWGLNEYGDLTADEYTATTAKPAEATAVPLSPLSPPPTSGTNSGAGMPSYIDGVSSASPPPPPPPPLAAPTGAGLPSYADSLSGAGSATTPPKQSGFMPQTYNQGSSSSSSTSYLDNVGSSAPPAPVAPPPAAVNIPPPPLAPPVAPATAAVSAPPSGASYMESLGGASNSISGAGLPSYADSLTSSASSNSSPRGAGLPSYADSLGGGGGGSSMGGGAGLSSYADSLGAAGGGGAAPAYAYSPPPPQLAAPAVPALSAPSGAAAAAAAGLSSYSDSLNNSNIGSTISGAGLPSYADSLGGGSGGSVGPPKPASFLPQKTYQEAKAVSGSYLDSVGTLSNTPSPPAPAALARPPPPPPMMEEPFAGLSPPKKQPQWNALTSDQANQLTVVRADPMPRTQGPPSVLYALTDNVEPLPCDQTNIMRATNPGHKTGPLEPDQSTRWEFFFTGGRVSSSSSSSSSDGAGADQRSPVRTKYPSDQELREQDPNRRLKH